MDLDRRMNLLIVVILFAVATMIFQSCSDKSDAPKTASIQGDVSDQDETAAMRDELKKKTGEVLWLEGFKQCLHAPFSPSWLFFETHSKGVVVRSPDQARRASVCACAYNGFAASIGKESIGDTFNYPESYPEIVIPYSRKRTISTQYPIAGKAYEERGRIAQACRDGSFSNPNTAIPDFSDQNLNTLKAEAQRLSDELVAQAQFLTCKSNQASSGNIHDCACIKDKMFEAFKMNRPIERKSAIYLQQYLIDTPEDRNKIQLIIANCSL